MTESVILKERWRLKNLIKNFQFMVFVITVSIFYLLLALKNLRWAIFVLAAFLPSYLLRFSIGHFPSTLLEVFIIITLAVWFFKKGYAGLNYQMLKPWRWPILLFMVAGIVSVIISPAPIAGLGLFRAYIIEPILIFFILISVLKDERDARKIIAAFGVSALVISVYAIIQRFTGFGIPDTWQALRRVTSFYPFPNAVGLFLGPLIPIFVSNVIASDPHLSYERWGKRGNLIFWIFVTVLSILAIIFSQTEGAWIGVMVGLFFMGLIYRKTRIPVVVLGSIILAAIIFTPQIREPITQKILLQDWSGRVRQTQWQETAQMLADRPIFGAGLSGYPKTLRPYHKATYVEIFQYPHNIILNLWSELGVLGVIAFGGIIFIFFKLLWRAIKKDDKNWLAVGLLGGMISLLVHGLVDVPYFKNDLAVQFWILVAAASKLTTIYIFPVVKKQYHYHFTTDQV